MAEEDTEPGAPAPGTPARQAGLARHGRGRRIKIKEERDAGFEVPLGQANRLTMEEPEQTPVQETDSGPERSFPASAS